MPETSVQPPKPFDITALGVHPAGPERGCIIVCHDQTAINVRHVLERGKDDARIAEIALLAVRFQRLFHLYIDGIRVLPAVMQARSQLRRLFVVENEWDALTASEQSRTIDAEVDQRLSEFGTMIATIKAATFTRLDQLDAMGDQLEALGVLKVDAGDLHAGTERAPDEAQRRARTRMAVRLEHARAEWSSGTTMEQVSQDTGFPVEMIIGRYMPSDREFDELLQRAAESMGQVLMPGE